ncbi:MAG TPA: class I SAM-dependent methyltransferase [Marmoricola sp.]|nr:class I SAM-dependent methyltransferase [Marmoricola sp.]
MNVTVLPRNMNRFHRWYCGTGHWRRHLTGTILPRVVAESDLGDLVLELGPGRGASTAWLKGTTGSLTSLELDPELAAGLEARFASDGQVAIVNGSATAVPFDDRAFSGVVCTTMLHHVPTAAEQDRLFAEARRVLAAGGVFCGSDSLSTPVFRLAHRGDVMNVVDPEALPDRLATAGFSEIEVARGSDFFTFRATA